MSKVEWFMMDTSTGRLTEPVKNGGGDHFIRARSELNWSVNASTIQLVEEYI
jgi:hypothetical protein